MDPFIDAVVQAVISGGYSPEGMDVRAVGLGRLLWLSLSGRAVSRGPSMSNELNYC